MKKLILLIIMTFLTASVFPSVYYVSSTNGSDTYNGSAIGPWEHISYAISQAAAGDTLMLSGTFYLGQDSGTTSNGIEITKSLTFIGEGAKSTFVKAHLNPGTAAYRVFKVNIGSAVTMMNMSIENGVSTGNGGAIVNWHVLNLIDVNISNNECADYGGAIFNYGNLTFNRVTMHDNTAGEYGGALYSQGLYAVLQSITMINTTISGNTATNNSGGGILLFAAANSRNVTIDFTMNCCTIADNSTGTSTGDGLNCATAEPSTYTALIDMDIRNSVFDNVSNYNENTDNGGSVNLARSYTFSSDETLPTTNSYYNSVDPDLDPLADNGGQTMTHATSFGSKIINAIPYNPSTEDYNEAPLTDQRGVDISRGSNKDAGSYEFDQSVTFYLNSEIGDDDTGDGSQSSPWANLSKALNYYYDGDIIDMTGTFYMTDDPNNSEEYSISRNCIIQGQSADQTVIKACPDGEQAESGLFVVNVGAGLTLRDISLANGYADYNGGGIQSRSELTLERVMIYDCSAPGNLNYGGAIYHTGSLLEITGSTIYNNTAKYYGGAIYLYIYQDSMTVDITNSTFSNNSAESGGGAIFATVSSNDQYTPALLTMNINSCTFKDNIDDSNTGNFLVHNTIGLYATVNTSINNSVITGYGNNFSGYPAQYTRNYTVSNDASMGTSGSGNINDVDCLLDILADNGGGILTCSLMEGSPAIDAISITAGTEDYNGAPLLDQRGVAIVNGNKDMGAYEGSIPYYLPSPEWYSYEWDGYIYWISWWPVERATNYAVYSSTEPYGEFGLEWIGEDYNTYWDKTVNVDRSWFFTVTAIDTTRSKGIPQTIEIKKP